MGTWEALTLGACIVALVSYLHSRSGEREQRKPSEAMLDALETHRPPPPAK